MLDAPTESRATLYIINYLDWQREGHFTFDTQRAKLLDTLAQILDSIQTSGIEGQNNKHILLGGETIILSDTASISDELLKSLLKYTQAGMLSVGPWYIHLDSLLANGEAIIRSLLLGQADSERYGISVNQVAFMPNNSQTVAQLPQILRNFGIDAAFIFSDEAIIPLPFNWQSPDGSGILVMNYQLDDVPEESIEKQRDAQPDGPFIWMKRTMILDLLADNLDTAPELPRLHSTLGNFAAAMRERLPDAYRPKLKGDLQFKPLSHNVGRLSARIAHKQAVMRLQAKLNHFAEPLLALSLAFGTPKFPEIQKALLDYSWRLLLQNMSPQTFAGAVNDDAYQEIVIRNRRVEDNSQAVIDKALQGLSGAPYQAQETTVASDETYLTVWNPHGQPVRQVVELELNLPTGKYPKILLDPDGEEQAFTWDSERKVIDFRADVPSIGFAVYSLKISQEKTAAYNQRRAVAGRSIGSSGSESLGLVGGRLDWTFANGSITDLLGYYDGGDAGDIWQYEAPKPDVVMKASLVDVVQVEATPTYERLIFRNRMRIAPNLKDGKERVRGLRVFDLTTTATYYNGLSGVHFQTRFTNTAEDHRLRVHLRTGIDTSEVYTDSAFNLSKHRIPNEMASREMVMQGVTALYDEKRGFALFTRGLPAFEAIRADKQITLGLSLLRSVAWLNKQQGIKADGAQMPDEFLTEFMLMPLDTKRTDAQLMRTSMTYQAPLQAFQYNEKPKHNRHSYLTIDGEDVVMTALKTPQNGNGIVVRVLNMSQADRGVNIQATQNLVKASRLNLAEIYQSDLMIENNRANLSLEPHQIATVRLEF